jgi:hypothetical protein
MVAVPALAGPAGRAHDDRVLRRPETPVRRLVPILLLVVLAPSAAALRCPDGLVDVGDHKVEVLERCGEPVSRDRVVEHPSRLVGPADAPVRQVLGVGVVTDEWVYEFSPQRFRALLRFRGGRLAEIESLPKPAPGP